MIKHIIGTQGHPGGIKSRTAKKILESKFPDRVIRLAVKRMIPKGPLGVTK